MKSTVGTVNGVCAADWKRKREPMRVRVSVARWEIWSAAKVDDGDNSKLGEYSCEGQSDLCRVKEINSLVNAVRVESIRGTIVCGDLSLAGFAGVGWNW